MEFSLAHKTATLSVGEFSSFADGPRESVGGAQGLWRAQLGQHWHTELRRQAEAEHTRLAASDRPELSFEIPLAVTLRHRGWAIHLAGRIDQRIGSVLREIKTVTRTLPVDEAVLRADYPEYFLQLAAYVVLLRNLPPPSAGTVPAPEPVTRAELVFVETGTGLAQTIVLTPFDEAIVFHQLDAVAAFLALQLEAAERRKHLDFRPPFATLRPGQETIQRDLAAALPAGSAPGRPKILLLEAPTGYGKTGCVLEFALGRLRAGAYDRLIWLTGKSTGQLQVMLTLRQMTAPATSSIIRYKDPAPDSEQSMPGVPPPPSPPDACHVLRDKQSRQNSAARSPSSPENDERETGRTFGHALATCHVLRDKLPITPSSGGLAVWQVRNKSEHCVNAVYHCVRDACGYLAGAAERWPQSGLNRFYLHASETHDLETLKAAGRAAQICPYEITRAALAFNDVWIGDYNYVFAPDNRGLFYDRPGFDPARTLLVIDEAHNLPSRVADAYSHAAREADARMLLAELDHQRAPAALVLAVEGWVRLLNSLPVCDALDPDVEADVRDQIGRLAELVATQPLDYAALGPRHCETLWQFPALEEFLAAATLRRLLWVPRAGELAFTCIDATEAVGATLRQFGAAILMSATLTPFAQSAIACGLELQRSEPGTGPDRALANPTGGFGTLTAGGFDKLTTGERAPLAAPATPALACAGLRAPAPWRENAYDVAVDLRVDTSFRHRRSHHGTTAATIEALHAAATAAKGEKPKSSHSAIAVFFPSYAYAEALQQTLEQGGSPLRIALQPRLPDLAAQSAWVEESLAFSDAIFLVLGSSFAEGIDLLGGHVTHAMIVGPALPEVNAVQKARLDAFSGLGRDAAFRRVYQVPGLQKVNQALGRLVRAPGQHAKVLLHCRRFAETSYATLLSSEYQFFSEIHDDSALHAWLRK